MVLFNLLINEGSRKVLKLVQRRFGKSEIYVSQVKEMLK